ncbi:GNAT family N-acetyltransferase [Entomohabitans teleogrylli]|uniref:GNAT family N-acetyltransferase n=1 Tax=Entomohabitans teleogrylli TaxID=1384589 RepID=UPI00073D7670|nr:GNAT family N-acetyltransferase [Entomohabitans teleogrylli]
MIIEKALRTDLPKILALQYIAYQSEARLCNNPLIPPLTQTLEEVVIEFYSGIFLKVENACGDIVASVRACSENGSLHIGKLIVHPDLQGQGIGTRLLREIEHLCPQRRYVLFTSNKSARNIRLYQRIGYTAFREQDMGDGLKFIFLEKIRA